MLNVSFSLAMVAATLFGIVGSGHLIEVDSLNSPTAKPIPDGQQDLVTNRRVFKGGDEQTASCLTPDRNQWIRP